MIEVQPTQGAGDTYWDAAQALCQQRGGTQYKLRFNGTVLTLPDAVADKAIREMVEAGWPLDRAYKGAGVYGIMPPAAMQPCIKEVFKAKYIDENNQWQHFGPHHTCMGFHNCLAEYIPALVNNPGGDPDRQRMQIAVGIYAPSPAEEACIKRQFVLTGEISRAYTTCGCSDLIPWWYVMGQPALYFIADALTAKPDERLYTVTKLSYILSEGGTSPPGTVPATSPTTTTPATTPSTTPATTTPPITTPTFSMDSKTKALLIVGTGAALLALLK